MSRMRRSKLDEGRLVFKRIECPAGGHIDIWIGDSNDNPNNENPPHHSINYFTSYYRLNSEKEWISRHRFRNGGMINGIINLAEENNTADQIWNLYLEKDPVKTNSEEQWQFLTTLNHILENEHPIDAALVLLVDNKDNIDSSTCEICINNISLIPELFKDDEYLAYLMYLNNIIQEYGSEVKSVTAKYRIELFKKYYNKYVSTQNKI